MKTNIQLLPTVAETIYSQIERYRELDQQIKALEKEQDAIKEELKSGYFKDQDEFVYQGRLLMTCTTQITERMDIKNLKLKQPDIYNLFQVETVSRVLRLK